MHIAFPMRPAALAALLTLPAAFTAPGAIAAPAGYHVDSRNGNDANDGSHDRPWRTLARLADARADPSRPINLRCDGRWRETLRLGPTQLAPGSVVQAYGACSNSTAVVDGSDDVSRGWTKSGSVWSRNIGAGRAVTQLFVNGQAHRVARWPNAPADDLGYALSDNAPGANNLSLVMLAADAAALGSRELAGATVYLRTGGAASQRLPVAGYDGATRTLRFGAKAARSIAAGHGYVLMGQRWMLDQPGEFLYDDTSGLLSVIPWDAAAQGDLNSARVEASVRDSAIELSHTEGVTLRGIGAVKARQNGVRVYDAPRTQLRSLTAIDNGRAGAAVISSTNEGGSNDSQVHDGVFVRNALYGIDASGAARTTIRGNAVRDTGTGMPLVQPMAAIWSGPGARVEANTVQRSGLTGIRFSGSGGSTVSGNLVLDSCLRFTDCGALYTWNGPTRSDWKSGQSSRVQDNVVLRAPVYLAGAGPSAPAFNVGLYYDAYSAGSVAYGNTVADLAVGIKLHDSSNITVQDNRIAGTSAAALWANMDDTGTDYLSGNVFERNQLAPASRAGGSYPATPLQQPSHAVWFWHKTLGSASIRSGANLFRGNDIVQLHDASIPVAWLHGADGDAYLPAESWAALAPQDAPARSPAQFALVMPTLGAELVGNGQFSSGLAGWDAWFAASGGSTGSLAAAALPGCSGTCARFAALTVNDTVISPAFHLAAGAMYQVSFDAAFLTPGSAARPGVVGEASERGLAANLSSASVLNGLPGQTLRYTGQFSAAAGETGTLRLAGSPGAVLGFDNVSLRPVTGYSTPAPAEWMRTAWADSRGATVGCTTLGWPEGCTITDLDGRTLGQPVVLPPFEAKTVLRGDSPARVR